MFSYEIPENGFVLNVLNVFPLILKLLISNQKRFCVNLLNQKQ